MPSTSVRGWGSSTATASHSADPSQDAGENVPALTVRIQGRAPLYDPVALRVMGTTLTLRNNEADHIEVEVE